MTAGVWPVALGLNVPRAIDTGEVALESIGFRISLLRCIRLAEGA
jgi:hypothetical protein